MLENSQQLTIGMGKSSPVALHPQQHSNQTVADPCVCVRERERDSPDPNSAPQLLEQGKKKARAPERAGHGQNGRQRSHSLNVLPRDEMNDFIDILLARLGYLVVPRDV